MALLETIMFLLNGPPVPTFLTFKATYRVRNIRIYPDVIKVSSDGGWSIGGVAGGQNGT